MLWSSHTSLGDTGYVPGGMGTKSLLRFLLFKIVLIFIYAYECLAYMYVCVSCAYLVPTEELELQMVLRHQVDAGNQILVLCESSSALNHMSHHSRPL